MRNYSRKGRIDECNWHCFWSAGSDVRDSAASRDAQGKATDCRSRITKDVSVLRHDYISLKNKLLRVRQVFLITNEGLPPAGSEPLVVRPTVFPERPE